MGSDAATANTSGPGVSRDVGGKKKKTNRSAKLKQCKLDARREQWLSQVKNKSCKVVVVNMHASSPSAPPLPLALHRPGKPSAPVGGSNSEVRSRREENVRTMGLHGGGGLDSQADSLLASRNVPTRKDTPASGIKSGSYFRIARNADDEGDKDVVKGEGRGEGSLDDWEAVADALAARAGGRSPRSSKHTAAVHETTGPIMLHAADGILRKPEPDGRISRAWRPDDVFRPQSLPKQHNFCPNSQWYCSQGTVSWAHHGVISQPSLCPICYEGLDLTDSSFLPCSCGFRLCLFCHKRILEADGRCPGCRKQYGPLRNGEISMSGGGAQLLALQVSRSYSMSSRS